jgi:flagellar hook assembly protein FlgD
MDPQLMDGVFAQQIVENGDEITYSLTGNDHAYIGSNVLAVAEEVEEAPSLETHMLGTPTPTPTSDRASFTVDLPFTTEVEIAVYDACGRMVRSLVDRELTHGKHTFTWDTKSSEGDPVASGAYYLRLTLNGGKVREIQRIIVTR